MNSYQEIVDDFTTEELRLAHRAIVDSNLQDELYQKESPLLVFLIDTRKQNMLYEWIEDQEYIRESEKNTDTSAHNYRSEVDNTDGG